MTEETLPGADLPPSPIRADGLGAPLEGLTVVDFTHFIAGPLATMILADLGATVLKIESRERGDELRYYPPAHPIYAGRSAPFAWTNRNKRSIALDLKSVSGRAIVEAVIARSDVLVENFSTGVMDRLGLGFEACRAINQRLIYCSLSAYGRDGNNSDRRGFDPVIQAETGFMSMNGFADREGVKSASTVMDIGAGLMMGNAIMAALLARHRTDSGQFVEVSLFDAGMTMVGFGAMQYLYTGKEPDRIGNTSPDTSPTGVFHARDIDFYMSCTSTRIFHKLFTLVIDRPDIAHSPDYQTPDGRRKSRVRLFEILNGQFGQHDWGYWQDRFRKAGVPAGEVRTLAGALNAPETVERQLVTQAIGLQGDRLPNISLPFRFSDTPVVTPLPAPALGEQTDEIMHDILEYDENAIAELRGLGVVGPAISAADAYAVKNAVGTQTT